MTKVKQLIYDLHPGKSPFRPPSAFKFNPVKFSDVCTYAIMSNHYHLVLKVNDTKNWSMHHVLIHWSSLCHLPHLCQKFMDKQNMSQAEMDTVLIITDDYRKRLMSISW
jgi:hypothetical protein